MLCRLYTASLQYIQLSSARLHMVIDDGTILRNTGQSITMLNCMNRIVQSASNLGPSRRALDITDCRRCSNSKLLTYPNTHTDLYLSINREILSVTLSLDFSFTRLQATSTLELLSPPYVEITTNFISQCNELFSL